MPKISVLLPAKNAAKYISACIDSILGQTYSDFEILIFNDNSDDETEFIINSFQDSRIKLYNSQLGFIENLNKGIELAQGSVIARMDADDIMHRSRLEIQNAIIEELNVDVCSSWMIFFGEYVHPHIVNQGLQGKIDDPLKIFSNFNFIAHPAVMLRKEFLISNNLKYLAYPYAEDYKLWTEIAKLGGTFYIEQKPLVAYRVSNDQVSRKNSEEVARQTFRIQNEVKKHLGYLPS